MKRIVSFLVIGATLVTLGLFQYSSESSPPSASNSQGVVLKQEADRVEILVDGAPFTTYYFEGYNKPIFFPLRAASGTIVTRGYPMIPDVPGETKDHPHHKGLWFTHGDINGVDFWSESDKSGRIIHRQFDAVQSGKSLGVLKSRNDWITPSGDKLLEEVREVRVHRSPNTRVMDFDLTLTAVNGPVKFGDTKEGSFGIRLAETFAEKKGGEMRNARGGKGEQECWGKPSEWLDYSARIGGETLGVAIFDHPTSFRHPTHWHARGYCLFAVNPFGLHDFYSDVSKDGSHQLKKGESIRFRYRVTIHPGNTEEARIADHYQTYAREKLQ